MKKIIKLIFMVIITFASQVKSNEIVDPVIFLDTVIGKVMLKLDKNRQLLAEQPDQIYNVIETLIVPYVDFVEMSKWICGMALWRKAVPGVQAAFVKEFKTLVVRTYSTALNNYTDEKIDFKPINPEILKRNKIQVSSFIVRKGKENLRMDYRLIRYGESWRVYDIIIEGISVLQGFQAQFSNDIRQQGLEMVTNKIGLHNDKFKQKVDE